MAKTGHAVTPAGAQGYTRAQLAESRRYAGRRDLISALLAEDRTYTLDEAEGLMEAFMKGKVN